MDSFESPLLITRQTEFTAIRFGHVDLIPAVAGLRDQLNALLYKTASELPATLAPQAHGILRGYSGGERNFYSLFYAPVWSFLHWAPAAVPVPPGALASARLAHAMSLFLHLWDDHLCDGQLLLTAAEIARTNNWTGMASDLTVVATDSRPFGPFRMMALAATTLSPSYRSVSLAAVNTKQENRAVHALSLIVAPHPLSPASGNGP